MNDKLKDAVERLRTKWVKTSTIVERDGTYRQDWIDDLTVIADAFLSSPLAEPVNAKLLEACDQFLEETNSLVTTPRVRTRTAIKELVAAARAQAKDDAKPVDEEWLKSIGFTRDAASHLSFRVREFATLTYLSSIPVLQVSQMGNFVNFHVDTRGDVRRLLSALGVKN